MFHSPTLTNLTADSSIHILLLPQFQQVPSFSPPDFFLLLLYGSVFIHQDASMRGHIFSPSNL